MGARVEALCLGIVKQGELHAPRFKRLIGLFRQPGPTLERPSESGSWETEPKYKPTRASWGTMVDRTRQRQRTMPRATRRSG
jgi:hypothetical protein